MKTSDKGELGRVPTKTRPQFGICLGTSIVLSTLFSWPAWSDSPEETGIVNPSNRLDKPAYYLALPEDDWPQCAVFSPDGSKVLAGTIQGNVWLWKPKEKAVPMRIRLTSGGLLSGSVDCIAISSDGGTALAGCADSGVRIIDLRELKVTRILKGHRRPVLSVAFSKDNQRGFSGSAGLEWKIVQWDLKTGKAIHEYDGKELVSSLAIAPDGRRFLTPEFTSIQEWDSETGKRLRTFNGHEFRIYGVFYSPDGDSFISAASDAVRVWDANTGKCLRTIGKERFFAERVALSTDGRRILRGGTREMQLYDLTVGDELKRWENLVGHVCVAFSPNGRYALSGENHGLSLWLLPESKEKPAK